MHLIPFSKQYLRLNEALPFGVRDGDGRLLLSAGACANLPLVAALVNAAGAPMTDPVVRDTADARHAIKCAMGTRQVKVLPPHERILALR